MVRASILSITVSILLLGLPVIEAQENLIGLYRAADRLDDEVGANTWLIAAQEQAWGSDSPRLRPALERQQDLLMEAGLKREAKKVKKRLKRLGG